MKTLNIFLPSARLSLSLINILYKKNQILEEIDEAIEAPKALKETIIDELYRLKLEFRLKLAEYIDDFSFKILSNIDRDMK